MTKKETEISEFVNWNKRYEFGIPLIDKQHQKLIQITNKLFMASLKGNQVAKDNFEETVKELVDYIKYHFSAEEVFMAKIGYPGLDTHKKEHQSFVQTVQQSVTKFEAGNTSIPKNFAQFLKDWILEHIAISDKLIADYFFKRKELLFNE